MLWISVVRCDTSGMSFLVTDDYTVRQGVQGILSAQHGKQLHGGLVGALRTAPGSSKVRTGKAAAAGIFDAGRLTHLHADVGVVAASPAAGAAVPSPVVPREGLVNRAVIGIDKSMDTGAVIGRRVPAVDEYRCLWLVTAHRMEHQPFDRDLAAGSVAGVLCQDRFNQFHLHISPFLEKRRCRSIPCE